jgi:hypothetical protein
MGERKGVYRLWVRKSKGKRQLGRHRSRMKDNIKTKRHEVGWKHGLD